MPIQLQTLVRFLALVPACAASIAAAGSSALDPSFGDGGRVWIGPEYSGSGPKDAHVLAMADGGTLVLMDRRLDRYDVRGVRDAGFGYGDAGLAGADPVPGLGILFVAPPVALPDGGVAVPLLVDTASNGGRLGVLRLRADGRRDPAFGSNGIAVAGTSDASLRPELGVSGVAGEPGGRMIVAGWRYEAAVPGASPTRRIRLARFLPDGSADEGFGADGRRELALDAIHDGKFVAGPDGSFALVFRDPIGLGMIRFLPGGEPDASFGPTRRLLTRAAFERTDFVMTLIDADSAVVVATAQVHSCNAGGCAYDEVVSRLDRYGRLDEQFGDAGSIVRTNIYDGFPDSPWYLRGLAASTVSPGALLLLTREGEVHRLERRGAPDFRASNGGVTRADVGFPVSFAVAADGNVVVASGLALGWDGEGPIPALRMALSRLRPNWEGRDGDLTVVEYLHAGFGHYFITPLASEQEALDRAGHWRRTGAVFRAWAGAWEDLHRVCRFWSGDMFLPKATHFYSYLDAECRLLGTRGSGWVAEAGTFAIRLPEGPAESRGCPTLTVPLYRAYNNGQGGAPNHRYTTSAALLDQMVAQGWVAEGEAGSRIFACVAAH